MKIYYTNNYGNGDGESHTLLEKAVAEHIGDKERAAELIKEIHSCTQYGKPIIDGFDEFSISHSNNTWAVLVADFMCGFDIQYSRDADVSKLAEKYYSEQERELVKKSGNGEFFRIWARREALVKAVGTTIVNTDLPDVLGSRVEFEDEVWIMKDVVIPGTDACAAACVLVDEEVSYVEIR